MTLSGIQLDMAELNEVFASQAIAMLRDIDRFNEPRVNRNGGATALGHPLGMSDARITIAAVEELHRTDGRYAVVLMCINVRVWAYCWSGFDPLDPILGRRARRVKMASASNR